MPKAPHIFIHILYIWRISRHPHVHTKPNVICADLTVNIQYIQFFTFTLPVAVEASLVAAH